MVKSLIEGFVPETKLIWGGGGCYVKNPIKMIIGLRATLFGLKYF